MSQARTIVITGAGTGFGRAAAVELAGRGHDVIATTETDEQAAALAAAEPGLRAQKLDVTDAADVAGLAALEPDVLINNAGYGLMGPMATVPLDEVRKSFDVNVFGMVAMSQAAIPGMKERGWGRIINVSSIAGVLASAQGSPYCMTKHAVEAFTKSLRAELQPHGIDVTKVNPGPYDTGFNDQMVLGAARFLEDGDESGAEAHEFAKQLILSGQLDPAEVATALADLAEADETPEELCLPEGIRELIAGAL